MLSQQAEHAGGSPPAVDVVASERQGLMNRLTPRFGIALVFIPVLLLVAYPIIWLVLSAFGVPETFKLDYFVRTYTNKSNFVPLLNTIWLALGVAAGSTICGVPLALAAARSKGAMSKFIRIGVALSYITPPYLTSIAYIILLSPTAGYLNRALRLVVPVETGPLNIYGMGGIIFVISMHCMAFVFFLTDAALRSIDPSFEEAAQMLGARKWTIARRISLPILAPAISGGALIAAIHAIALFGPQAFLGIPGQVTFLLTRIFGIVNAYPPRFGDAAALSIILVVLTCIGLYIQRAYLGTRSYVTVSGKGGLRSSDDSGPRWPLYTFATIVLLFSAVAPLVILVLAAFSKSWIEPPLPSNLTLENFRVALFDNDVTARSIANSFKFAIGAGVLAVLIGTAVSYLDLRTKVPGRRLLTYLSILPMGIPGMVLALAMILAFIRPPLILYSTPWIMLAAYVAHHIPAASRTTDSTFRQLDPTLEEAARITGASWMQAMRRILVPLARPGLVIAFLLVFVPTFSELSSTILLYSPGNETVAIAIYNLNDLGSLEIVSAMSVFVIAVVFVVSALLNWLSGRARSAANAGG